MKVTVTTTVLYSGCYIHTAVFHHPITKKRMECENRGATNPCWDWHKARAVKNQIVYDLHYTGYEISRRNINFHITPFKF